MQLRKRFDCFQWKASLLKVLLLGFMFLGCVSFSVPPSRNRQSLARWRTTVVGAGVHQHWNGGEVTSSSSAGQMMVMRDRSSAYWFCVGDAVKVVDDVYKAGYNLKGRMGIVLETWEKCDVDPTCCCAENVDCDMNIRVEFQGTEETSLVATITSTHQKDGPSFYHYFAEDELEKMPVAFDGLSCQAFKVDQLHQSKNQ